MSKKIKIISTKMSHIKTILGVIDKYKGKKSKKVLEIRAHLKKKLKDKSLLNELKDWGFDEYYVMRQ
jgi:hypothetical protein